jgi:hypothetical protein
MAHKLSLTLYLNLKAAGVSTEHIYAHTGHGFGVRPNKLSPVWGWIQNFFDWMGIEGMLKHN